MNIRQVGMEGNFWIKYFKAISWKQLWKELVTFINMTFKYDEIENDLVNSVKMFRREKYYKIKCMWVWERSLYGLSCSDNQSLETLQYSTVKGRRLFQTNVGHTQQEPVSDLVKSLPPSHTHTHAIPVPALSLSFTYSVRHSASLAPSIWLPWREQLEVTYQVRLDHTSLAHKQQSSHPPPVSVSLSLSHYFVDVGQ